MSKVTVYCYTGYNIATDEIIASKRMATFDAIRRFNCNPLMHTAKEVEVRELDDEGRYPRTMSEEKR